MAQQLTRAKRSLIGALAFALAFASTATCIAAVMEMRDAQKHACCAGMGQDCGIPASAQMDCCAVQSADVAPATSAAQFSTPHALVVRGLLPTKDSLASPRVVAAFEPGAPIPSSHPTYLLVSVFRI